MEEKKRFRFRFSGIVQGVGFRYTAYHLAAVLGLTGWVYNEWDGSVLVEVQGAPSTISQFVERLDGSRFIHIDDIEKKELPLDRGEVSFSIRF